MFDKTTKHSYSTISAFDTCPRKFAEEKIWKNIKYKQNAAAQWGSEGHKAFEDAIKARTSLENRFSFAQPVLDSIYATAGEVKLSAEYELGLDAEGKPCRFWDGKLRGKLDLHWKPRADRAVITDWKFAKHDPSKYKLETDVFSYLTMKNDEEVEAIKTVLVWLKAESPGKPTVKMYNRSDLTRIEDDLHAKMYRIEKCVADDYFPEKPTGLCKNYCDVVECHHNGKYRSK